MVSRARLVAWTRKAKSSDILDTLVRYNPIAYEAARRHIAAFERADLAERQRLSTALLERVMIRARATAHGRGHGPRLADWPILDKVSVRDAPDRFARPGLLRIPASTSGTTGTPLTLWRSLPSIAAERAFIDWLLADPALSFRRSRSALLRDDNVKPPSDRSPPFGVYANGGRTLILSGAHLSVQTIDWFVAELLRHRPIVVGALPSRLVDLAVLLQRSGSTLHIPVILSSSEMLPTATRRMLAETFGARVIDSYGQAERVSQAVSHREDEFWFNPAYGFVELLREPEDPSSPDRLARIVATGFWNSAMPLVRYDTGDRAVLPSGASDADIARIALGLMPFVGIAGRAEEFLFAPDGRRIRSLSHIPREVPNLLQVQFVQPTPDRVIIRITGKPAFGAADRERLLHNARNKIPEGIAVEIELVERLTVLANGKTPLVLHRPPPS